MFRTYSELIRFETFEERFAYLQLNGVVGSDTFGHERYLNQTFYTSYEWRKCREHVIARDFGCDLGVDGFDITTRVIIHHMNPITVDDIKRRNGDILNPEYLITTKHETHNALHYGGMPTPQAPWVERTPGDTTPWG